MKTALGTRHKALLLGAGLLVFGGIAARGLVWEPAGARLEKLRIQKEAELEKKRILEATAAFRKNLAPQESLLLTEADAAPLLEALDALAEEAGLAIASIAPMKPEKKGFYVKVPVEIRSRSTYHALARFVSRVESAPRFFKLDRIRAEEVPVSAEGADTVEVTLVISAFAIPLRD
jgi:type IV pilus assembly protein PilO